MVHIVGACEVAIIAVKLFADGVLLGLLGDDLNENIAIIFRAIECD